MFNHALQLDASADASTVDVAANPPANTATPAKVVASLRLIVDFISIAFVLLVGSKAYLTVKGW